MRNVAGVWTRWSVMLGVVAGTLAAVSAQQLKVVDDAALRRAGDVMDGWLSYGGNQAETRFSRLTQIDATNVGRLKLIWSYDLPTTTQGAQEGTPLVANGTIYSVTNWSVVFAVDALTGKEKWRWDPWVNQAAVAPEVCCGITNRGLALYRGFVYVPVIDGRLQALDADTGQPVWEARVAFPQDHYTLTMAPRIAKGKVIIGASGGDHVTRGFFDAYDAMTGRRAWRFYTVPGDPSKPFENEAMKKAAATWDREWWKNGGGGAVWDGLAYDPDEELVYVGTGNAQPWTFHHRSSKEKDNLYVCSILAVDVDTGQLKWHYQVVPGDNWDYDSVQHLILADLPLDGRTRKVIMQANKNGFFYVLDRVTGQFLSAQPFARVTWAKGIDPKTGRPIVNDEAYYGTESVVIQPGAGGAHNWAPMAFSPMTGLVYIPTNTNSSTTFAAEAVYTRLPPRRQGAIATGTMRPAPSPTRPALPSIGPPPIEGGPAGAIVAWDPMRQEMKWRHPLDGGVAGGTLTTAGNLVLQVVANGRLLAFRADTGEKLLDLPSGVRGGMGPPITYRIDRTQYVAFMGGIAAAPPAAGDVAPQAAPAPPASHPRLMVFAVTD